MNNYVTKFENAVADYLAELELTGASKQTIRNYNSRLTAFKKYYESVVPTTDPTVSIVKGWRDSLLNSGLSNNSVRQYLNELSYFFNAMSDESLDDVRVYESNPVSNRLLPKTEKKLYDTLLDDEDVIKLLDLDNYSGANKYRNYAIIMLLLTSKMRNKELLDLTLDDIDFEYKEIDILHGKGNKERICDLHPLAESAIKMYLEMGNRPSDVKSSEVLFGTEASHEFGTHSKIEWHRGTSQWLSELCRRTILGITGVDKIRTHDLRHIGSRVELNAGVSIEYLQSELGHSSVTTTEIYSGRLMQKRHRQSAQKVITEYSLQAEKNFGFLGKNVGNVLATM